MISCTEFHTRNGPFTLVPLPDKRSSLVWVSNETEAERVKALDEKALNLELEHKMHSILGKVSVETKVQTFPLSSLVSEKFGHDRIALVGEAAHVMPPIGAQGFNLGLRDVESICASLGETSKDDWGQVGSQYHSARSSDVNSRVASIDLLNRSLLSDFLPVQFARSAGLLALGALAPLRKFLMKQGVASAPSPQ